MIFRVTEQACYYPPLRKARDLIASGIIGDPTVVRIKTVVGRTESEFQANLDPAGYSWRFNNQSPGGHLFDDVMHKYAMALWLVDEQVRSVQADRSPRSRSSSRRRRSRCGSTPATTCSA